MVSNRPVNVTLKCRKGTIHPGINAASRALGVSRITLYRVLKGQLPDRQNLTNRYAEWLSKAAGQPPVGGPTS